jgi:hypothetical protein
LKAVVRSSSSIPNRLRFGGVTGGPSSFPLVKHQSRRIVGTVSPPGHIDPRKKAGFNAPYLIALGASSKSPVQWFRRLGPEVHRRTGNAKLLALPCIIAQQPRNNQMFNIGAAVGIAGDHRWVDHG